jgi:UDP-N-acetyl-D-mannosaminuronic acid dehydrogenase
MKINSVCILGLGYIGLPTACMFAQSGLTVIGVDVNQRIVSSLQNGEIHIYEPGLHEVAHEALTSGKLIIQDCPSPADAFVIAVPTPFYDDKKADLRAVKSAAGSIVPYLSKGNLVVLESTSPPLTTVDIVAPILEQSGLKAGIDFFLTYSPERVLPGKILDELIHNDRVIGGINTASSEAGSDLYSSFVRGRIILTDATTAEMVKLMENTYRDVNIAIANEFSRLAERFGVNIWEAIQTANLHPRVKILQPGVGVGGHCISVDPWFLVEAAPDLTSLIHTARRVNDSQPEYIVNLFEKEFGPALGQRITVLGLSYKPDVDDLRESPAVELAHLLIKRGAIVKAYEPFRAGNSFDGIDLSSVLGNAVKDADAIMLAVGHKQFIAIQPDELAQITKCRRIFDPLHGWNEDSWEKAGFTYAGLGIGEKGKERENDQERVLRMPS